MRPFFMAEIMFTAKKKIIVQGRVIEKGERLKDTPENAQLFELGYLDKKPKAKKPKKSTTHED